MEIDNDRRKYLMDTLSKKEQDILLDYYFECADQQEAETARQLLQTHQGAMEFYNRLNHSLSALEHLDHEAHANCPDHLVENTLAKLYAHESSSGPQRLEQLLQAESGKIVTTRTSFWRSLAETAAVAAAVVIFSGLFVPVTRSMRAHAWQAACESNLSKIAQGVTQYAGDHQGMLPAVATKAGNPWWKVGSTQPENQSNTRHVWLLVKQGYIQPEAFICPGGSKGNVIKLDKVQIASLADFPNRRYITYSFKLISDSNKALLPTSATAIMSDTNPIFEPCLKAPDCLLKNELDPITLNASMLKMNSSSHRSKGQNVMFSVGAVKFLSGRLVDENDDIFTAKGQDTYKGTETASSEKDVFLVP
jgi:anti-sigma-K factor RskA